ncbi:MAG TPA: dienelactone hydrolase family protein [Vicinamibacterales bacterium]|jgi:carboxymethylenebutenolidase
MSDRDNPSPLVHSAITRREFFLRAAATAGAIEVAGTIIAGQAPQDPLESIALAYRSTDEKMTMGYLSRPRAEAPVPGIVIVHDSSGLNDHIREIARRVAASDYMVVAPDFLSRQGGTPHFRGNDADVLKASQAVTTEHLVSDSGGAIAYMKSTKRLRDNRVGTIGFGWGATGAFAAAASPDVRASVLFYGIPRIDAKLLAKLRAPVLAIFAGEDAQTSQGIPAFEEALKKAGRQYQIQVYPGVRPGFDDATAKDRYNAEAAKDAWAKTLAHLDKSLKNGAKQ